MPQVKVKVIQKANSKLITDNRLPIDVPPVDADGFIQQRIIFDNGRLKDVVYEAITSKTP